MNNFQKIYEEIVTEGGITGPHFTKVLGAFQEALREQGISKVLGRLITEMAIVAQKVGISKSDWRKVVNDLFSAVKKMKEAEENRNQQFMK